MRAIFLVLVLLFLTGCLGGGSNSSRGIGVETIILNGQELGDVYLPYGGDVEVISSGNTRQAQLLTEQGWVPLFDINALVYNRGNSNALVAMYITGFDPNLFDIEALGPYVRNENYKFCYKGVSVSPGHQYSAQIFCEAFDDVFLGGAINVDGDGSVDNALFSFIGLDASSLFRNIEDGFLGGVGDFLEDTGLLDNLAGSCEWRDSNSNSGKSRVDLGGANFNLGREVHCSLNWGFPGFVFDRASKGNLLLGLYGTDLIGCGNGCTLVPAQTMPETYIAGDTEEYPGGQGFYVDHRVWLNKGRWPANLNDHQQLFQVSTCSLYTTYLTPIVCIDPTPATSDGEVCRAGSAIIDQYQGAPIIITQIDQRPQGPRTAFTIHVENRGGGRPFDPGAIDYCSPASPSLRSRQHVDVARVIDARVLGAFEGMDCKQEVIRFQNGKGQITCLYNIPPQSISTGAFQTTLVIEIGYLYRDINTLSVNIHRI